MDSKPQSFLPISVGLNENMEVSELIQQLGKWNSDLIQQSYLAPDYQVILTIPLSLFNHKDSWLWHYTNNGIYSVKSGYKVAKSAGESGPSSSSNVITTWWKAFWTIKILKKIMIFGW